MQKERAVERSILPDYDEYTWSIPEAIFYVAQGAGIIFLFSYIFYRSVFAAIFLSPILIPFLKEKKKESVEKRKRELSVQFREMMNSVIAGLQAGYSVENAFAHSYEDIVLLFGENSMMSMELKNLRRSLKNNINLEDVLTSLGERSHISDIADFAEVFRIAKRSGGDLPGILKNAASVITDKMEVRREITTMISAKKMEQNIMNVVPFGIILYIDFSSPGFFDSLYHNLFGVVLMSVMMGIYLFAYFLAKKITDIAV